MRIFKTGRDIDVSSFKEQKDSYVVSQGWPVSGDVSCMFKEQDNFSRFFDDVKNDCIKAYETISERSLRNAFRNLLLNIHSGDVSKQLDKNSRKLYPDFYKSNCVADAKYKRLSNGVCREDLYQVVTYMHCLKAEHGLFIYPIDTQEKVMHHELCGYGGKIHVIPVCIPQNPIDFKDFKKQMVCQETLLIGQLGDIIMD